MTSLQRMAFESSGGRLAYNTETGCGRAFPNLSVRHRCGACWSELSSLIDAKLDFSAYPSHDSIIGLAARLRLNSRLGSFTISQFSPRSYNSEGLIHLASAGRNPENANY